MLDGLAATLAAFAVGAFLVHETYSLDVWWQVIVGRHVLAQMALPETDHWAVAALGHPYHDAHWLFQVLLALADRAGGMAAVQVLPIVFWGGTLFCVHRSLRRWAAPPTASLLTAVVGLASVERFLPRPELVTFFLIALFSWLLQESRRATTGRLLLFAALQAVWTNAHGLFVCGPFLVGCYWLVAVVRRARTGEVTEAHACTKLLSAVLVGTALTPFGLRGWSYAALLVSQVGAWAPELFADLGELSPTFGAAARSGLAFWLYALLLVAFAGALLVAAARREVPWPRLLVALGLLAASFSGRRNVVPFALVAAPFVAEIFSTRLLLGERRRPLVLAPLVALAALAGWPLTGGYYVALEIPARFGWGVTPSFFPHGLPAFLDRIGFAGRVLNSNTLGGFYLYHGYPRRLPLTDGRWVSYDPELLDWTLRASRQSGTWREVVRRFELSGILLAHSSPEAAAILPEIQRDPGWRLAYLDQAASFWLPAGAEAPAAVPLARPEDLPSTARVDDGLILDRFLELTGRRGLQLWNLRRTRAFGQRTATVLERQGMAELALGRWEEAEQTFSALLEREPRSLAALNELAFLAFRRGDLERAERRLADALRIAPDDPELAENLRRIRAARGR